MEHCTTIVCSRTEHLLDKSIHRTEVSTKPSMHLSAPLASFVGTRQRLGSFDKDIRKKAPQMSNLQSQIEKRRQELATSKRSCAHCKTGVRCLRRISKMRAIFAFLAAIVFTTP